MRTLARALRIDGGTWYWLESEASWAGSIAIMLGAYLILAFDRFGWPDFALGPTAQWMVVGVVGWLWLALAPWLTVAMSDRPVGSLRSVLVLVGHAHLPLLLVAVVIQVVTVNFNVTGVALLPAAFVAVFWMPAMLVGAVSAALELEARRAIALATVPYLLWVALLGRPLWDQLAHLM